MKQKDDKKERRNKTVFASVSAEEKISGRMIALIFSVLVSFLMIALCALNLSKEFPGDRRSIDTDIQGEVTTSVTDTTEVTEQPRETVSEYVFNAAQISQFAFEQIIEAEDADGSWSLTEDSSRPGYSGTGYLTDFSLQLGNSLSFSFDIPAEQHYDISVCFASDEVMRNEVLMDGEQLFDFECTEETTGRFVIKTYYGVFLEAGTVNLTVHEIEAGIDLDYIKITNNQSIYTSRTDVAPSLVNPDASKEALELMSYLTENFGKRILTGQYVSDARSIEIEKIYENTSSYPAVRFGDMSMYSTNTSEKTAPEDDEISAAVKWAEKGGIVGYIWHWRAPLYENEFYSEKTDFDLSLAVSDYDVAVMPAENIEKLYQDGYITAETLLIIRDIDYVSEQLARLKEKNIPVLWRPLHEASGDWFWWGNSGPDCYKWLWNLLYRRMTSYHKLNNLIWIWSAQGSDYFIGNSMFDIASVDLYSDNTDNTSYYKQYQWLYSLTGGQKLIALSECGTLPDIELTFRDRAVWSFFGLWYGDYILDKDGNLSEKYNTREALMKMYNANRTITLEKYKTKSVFREEEVPVTSAVSASVSSVTEQPVTETSVTTVPVTEAPEPEEDEWYDDEDYQEEEDW